MLSSETVAIAAIFGSLLGGYLITIGIVWWCCFRKKKGRSTNTTHRQRSKKEADQDHAREAGKDRRFDSSSYETG